MSGTTDSSPSPDSSDISALLREGAGRWALDPASSRVEFRVKHFWHAITVHGRFDRIEGEGTVAADGAVSGQLRIDAASLDTRNRQRDKHLRSADFFDVEHHPQVIVTVTGARPADGALACQATVEAAGQSERLEFTARIEDAAPDAVSVRAELVVDRTTFGMTWSPLRMASRYAKGIVVARLVRS